MSGEEYDWENVKWSGSEVNPYDPQREQLARERKWSEEQALKEKVKRLVKEEKGHMEFMQLRGIDPMPRFERTGDNLPSVTVNPIRGNEWRLVAAEDIRAKSPIGVYNGEKYTETDRRYATRLASGQNHYMLKHIPTRKRRETIIDALLAGSIIRYADHACGEGATCFITQIGDDVWLVARRDIKDGEPLTFDYEWEMGVGTPWEKKFPTPCKCGTRYCRGSIETTEDVVDWLRGMRPRDVENAKLRWSIMMRRDPEMKPLVAFSVFDNPPEATTDRMEDEEDGEEEEGEDDENDMEVDE